MLHSLPTLCFQRLCSGFRIGQAQNVERCRTNRGSSKNRDKRTWETLRHLEYSFAF
jgi:hypothetical protein